MKKILAWMLALCLLLSLAACGGPAVSPVGPDEGGEPVGVQDPENDKENNGPDETDDIGDPDGSGGGSGSSSKPSGSGSGSSSGSSNKPSGSGSGSSSGSSSKPSGSGSGSSSGSSSKPSGSGSGSSSGSSNKPSGSGSGSSSGSSDKPSSGGSGSGNSSKPGHKHSYTSKVVAATCTAGGYTLHTCSCGDSYKDAYTNALGHSYTSKVVAATCTAGGYTLHTCSRCGNNYKGSNTSALGHSYTSKVVAPTTEAGGYTLHTCSRCGSSYKDSYTDPLPKPEVYLDCAAAEAYGNQYALSLFHHIDATLRDGNAGYIPSSTYDRKSLLSWGGQTALNNEVCEKVNSTYRRLLARGDTAEDLKLYAGIRCEVVYAASRDEYTITVYYG